MRLGNYIAAQKQFLIVAAFVLLFTFISFAPNQLQPIPSAQAQALTALVPPTEPTGKKPPDTKKTEWCTEASTCVSGVIYVFSVGLGSMLAYMGSSVLNLGIQLSLQSEAYSQLFLTTGWAAARDIANMLFIFILIYIAFTIIYSAETANTMKTLAAVVVMALLINFSFFITRVVIDAGNILAVQFYNAIPSIPAQQSPQTATGSSELAKLTNQLGFTTGEKKDLTYHLMETVKVQKILDEKSFQKFTTQNGFLTNLIVQSTVYLVLGWAFAIIALTFFAVGFKFVLRIIVLWFVIIAAPLAFAMRAFASNETARKLYNEWQSALIKFSFYPAVFLFMFLIMNFIMREMGGGGGLIPDLFNDLSKINVANDTLGAAALGAAMAQVIIRLGFVVVMLLFGLKLADQIMLSGSTFAENFTKKASDRMQRTFGSGIFGSAGWTARHTIGRAGAAYAKSKDAKEFASNSVMGRFLVNRAEKLSTSNFDVRATRAKSWAQKADFNIGNPNTKLGGFAKRYEDRVTTRVKEQKGLVDKYKRTPEEIAADDKKEFDKYVAGLSKESRVEIGEAFETYKKAREANEGVESAATKAALKAAQKGLNDSIKPFNDDAKKRGNAHITQIADSIDRGGFIGGIGSTYIPFVRSKADKIAAKEIRDSLKTPQKDRLLALAEGIEFEKADEDENNPQPQPRRRISRLARPDIADKLLEKIDAGWANVKPRESRATELANLDKALAGVAEVAARAQARAATQPPAARSLYINPQTGARAQNIPIDTTHSMPSRVSRLDPAHTEPETSTTAPQTTPTPTPTTPKTPTPQTSLASWWNVPKDPAAEQLKALHGIKEELEEMREHAAETVPHNKTTEAPVTINQTVVQVGSTPPKTITPEAKELLASIDKGGVPAFMTQNLRRVLQQNGIKNSDISQKPLNELLEQLRKSQA